ncbi:MAG: DUF3604 domain-containing protein [Proteobacteria bacterium]|nr:DUF3604 domain-containing protein [Pseudomonadota bacterium]
MICHPTCRWTSYDVIRLGRQLDPSVPATAWERV